MADVSEMQSQLLEMGRRARIAAAELAVMESSAKNACLCRMASRLRSAAGKIIAANSEDVANAVKNGLSAAMTDRLTYGKGAY